MEGHKLRGVHCAHRHQNSPHKFESRIMENNPNGRPHILVLESVECLVVIDDKLLAKENYFLFDHVCHSVNLHYAPTLVVEDSHLLKS